MKAIMSIILLSFSFSSFALTLRCTYGYGESLDGNRQYRYQDPTWDNMEAYGLNKSVYFCKTKKGGKFIVKNLQVGPELYWVENIYSGFKIFCPFISTKKLEAKIRKHDAPVKIGGIHASAGSLLVSARVGLAGGLKTGLCSLSAAGIGLGGGVSIDSISIDLRERRDD